ncbi:MAG: hypothetical protein JWN15_724 [Firmicutes bacterium]|nr:hypothetical protein [Bacillota bacterium]
MTQTYSTLRRDAAHGRVYSSQYSSAMAVPPLRRGGLPGRVMVPAAPVVPGAVAQVPVAQAPVAQVPAAQVPAAQVPVAQVPVAQVPVAEVPVAQVPVAQAPVAQVPSAPVPASPDLAGLARLAGVAGLTAPAQMVPGMAAQGMAAQGMPAAALQAMAGLTAPTRAPSAQAAAAGPGPAVLQAAAAITQSLGLQPNALAPVPAQTPLPAQTASGVPASATFNLTTHGLPGAARIAPGGASGTLTVAARPGGGHSVTGTVQGVRPLTDPALRPVCWLIHDLTVPHDLSPADLAALPRGRTGTGNQPGTVFTIDGNAPTYTPDCNTISICISPGSFNPDADGTWKLDGTIDAGTNLAFHPLVFLGPAALADINAPMPTGTSARILTDLFMRPATVHPALNGRTQFPQRLMAIVRDVLSNSPEPAFLSPDRFTRAAVAIEGLVRSTPSLMPSRDTTFLLAN